MIPYLVLIGFFSLLLFAIFKVFSHAEKEKRRLAKIKEHLAEIKEQYLQSLNGTDKAEALRLGRLYYSTLRKGSLTIYDEQAIANDLSAMK